MTAPVVIITGASSGIGLALAHAYARDGARLVLAARDEAKLTSAANNLRGHAGLALLAADIGAANAADRILRTAVERFGRLDTLINNAGSFFPKPIADYSLADIDAFMGVNLRGTILLSQAAVRQFRAQRGGGSILNITSAISLAPLGAIPASVPNATKGALNTFTRSLALELASEGVRVNAVAPGLIKTPLHARSEEEYEAIGPLQPVGHLGEVTDVVAAVQYLAAQPFTTGTVLTVDGGASLGHW